MSAERRQRRAPAVLLFGGTIGLVTSVLSGLALVPRVRLVDVLVLIAGATGAGSAFTAAFLQFRRARGAAGPRSPEVSVAPETRIRQAHVDDIPAMHRVRLSVHENRLANPASVQPRHYAALLEGEGRGWVAEVEGRVVGFAVADRTHASVWALFVHPQSEGRGIGRRLHEAMIEWLFEAGSPQLRLSTDPGTRAERFYVAAGWRLAAREPNGEARYELLREAWVARPPRSSPP